ISLDQQQRRIVLSLSEHLTDMDDEEEMHFRAEVQKRAAQRAESAPSETTDDAAAEANSGATRLDENEFEEIEESLGDS
ncbi:hypothetical protein K8I85_13395, partial [bacterium]|nr:hypothetical protein [bacterium]